MLWFDTPTFQTRGVFFSCHAGKEKSCEWPNVLPPSACQLHPPTSSNGFSAEPSLVNVGRSMFRFYRSSELHTDIRDELHSCYHAEHVCSRLVEPPHYKVTSMRTVDTYQVCSTCYDWCVFVPYLSAHSKWKKWSSSVDVTIHWSAEWDSSTFPVKWGRGICHMSQIVALLLLSN